MRRSGSHGAREIRALRLRRSAATPAGPCALHTRANRVRSGHLTLRGSVCRRSRSSPLRSAWRWETQARQRCSLCGRRFGSGRRDLEGPGTVLRCVVLPPAAWSFGEFLRSFPSAGPRLSALLLALRPALAGARARQAHARERGGRGSIPAGSFRGKWRECLLDTQTRATQALRPDPVAERRDGSARRDASRR
jgi:hypothetical protein